MHSRALGMSLMMPWQKESWRQDANVVAPEVQVLWRTVKTLGTNACGLGSNVESSYLHMSIVNA